MNKENIISFAKNFFGDIKPIKEDLYRGQISITNRFAGVYYLDFNQDITLDNFNDYQENLLANEYYNLDSNQQWNFYLFILRDSINLDFKSIIERNDRYARKYVFNEHEFEDYFTIDTSVKQIKTTLLDEWKKKLDSGLLTDVYGDLKIKDIVQKLEVGSGNESIAIIKDMNEPIINIDIIRKLDLKNNYRFYPNEPRTFEFKKVNLITGINGSGKTSLFEAIELSICGMAFRNPTHKEKDGSVEAWFNDFQTPELFKPSQVDKYRKRDISWYGSSSVKLNRLHYSFNRFNFFNADAAHQFSTSNIDEDVRKSLFNIILGPEYDLIRERVERLLKEVRPAYNKLEIAYKDWGFKKDEADNYLKGFTENESLNSLAIEIDKNITKLKPRVQLPKVSQSHIESEKLLSDILICINELLENKLFNSESLMQNIISHKQQKDKLKEFELEIGKVEGALQRINDQKNELLNKLDILNQTKIYFTSELLFKVDGIQVRILEAEGVLSKMRTVSMRLGAINLNTYSMPRTIQDITNEQNDKYNKYRTELQNIEDGIQVTLNRMQSVEKSIKEIKLLGQAYVESDISIHICPLCETNFKRDELLKRIQNKMEQSDLSVSSLSKNYERVQELKLLIENIRVTNSDLSKLRNACETIDYLANCDNLLLSELIEEIKQFLGDESAQQLQLDREKNILELIHQHNISEETFKNLKTILADSFPDKDFVFSNHSYFLDKENEISDELNRLTQDQNLQNKIKSESWLKVKSQLLLPVSEIYTLNQLQHILSIKGQELGLSQNLLNNLAHLIEVNSISFKEIQLIVSQIQSDMESYKSDLALEFQWREMNKQKIQAEAYLIDNKARYDRFKIAFETLNDINEKSADNQVNIFFKQHLSGIIDIFKTIHTPREFKNIEIDEDGCISLFTINNEKRKVTQISTGQRSALAISIFLALNRSLKNGPNVILFDDPVAFIDDLNALSFLDFLRFFILKEQKQIFFSTANHKLANLFEKKFKFLEDDFRKWELQRSN